MAFFGLAVLLFSVLDCRSERENGLAGLAGARPGNGRLSQLPWASYSPAKVWQTTSAFRRTANLARQALAASRTSETLRNDAVIALVAGDTGRGITELTEATELSTGDATLWSDLAAAHLQRGASLSDPYELVLALAAANRAVGIDPSLLSARFNRALAHEGLSLRRAAVADWQMLKDREQDPGWQREARDHAAALDRPIARVDWNANLAAVEEAIQQGDEGKIRSIVSGSPQRFREHVEESVVPTLGSQDGAVAEKSLATARAVGKALATNHGGRMVADTVHQIDGMRAADPESFRQLAWALQAYGEGISLMQQEAFSQALPHFRTARKVLSELRSPFAGWAMFQAGYCQIRIFDLPNARTSLEELTGTPWIAKYKALHGRTLWMLALIEAIEGNLTTSLTNLEIALAAFEALGEKDNVAWLSAFVAVAFDYLGKQREAWRRLYPALRELEYLNKPQAQMAVWHAAASLAHEQGEFGLAQAFVDELLHSTKLTGQASAIVEALRWRAVILAKLGRKVDAARDLREAWSFQQRVSDPQSQRSLEGDLRLAEGELAVNVSPEQAIAALNPAIEIFRSLAYHYQLGHALYLRALAEDKLGRFDDEERDLAAAIAELERQREKVTEPEERVSYLDRRREILDSMISFQLYRRRRPAEALRFSENAKARVLWDWILTQPGSGLHKDLDRSRLSPAHSGALAKDLPERTAVIEYAVLPQSTIIWLLRRDMEPKVVTVKVGTKRWEDLIQTLQRAVLDGQSTVLAIASEQLHDILLKPVKRDLFAGERLVFIPDGPLHGLPFALLRDRQTGKYLIQDHVCSVAPSIQVFKASLHRDKFLARRITPRALMIADPDFDRTMYPSLPRLSAAKTEAAIAQTFPGSQVLRARDATRRTFLNSAGDFEIVHFGGHSVVNTEFPLLSQMVLAEDTEDPNRGVLYSGDLLHQHFSRTRLVVLASCETAAGRISRTEGVENLARPFLAAGVPAVVASLWSVDDDSTSHFFSRFYKHLHSSFDAAAALRAAQIEAIELAEEESRDPRTWAAFEVIGGSALPDSM